jgi:hypothetical protein
LFFKKNTPYENRIICIPWRQRTSEPHFSDIFLKTRQQSALIFTWLVARPSYRDAPCRSSFLFPYENQNKG